MTLEDQPRRQRKTNDMIDPKKRQWLQISLKAIIIITLLTGILVGTVISSLRERHATELAMEQAENRRQERIAADLKTAKRNEALLLISKVHFIMDLKRLAEKHDKDKLEKIAKEFEQQIRNWTAKDSTPYRIDKDLVNLGVVNCDLTERYELSPDEKLEAYNTLLQTYGFSGD